MTRPRNARCPENVLGWIAWYADDALSARQRGAVEAHAAECADCRAELEIISGAPFEIDHDLPDPDRLFQEITARIDAAVEEETGDRAASVIPIDRDRPGHTAQQLERLERFILDDSLDGLPGGAPGGSGASGTREDPGGSRFFRTGWMAAAALVLLFLGGLGGALVTSLGSRFGVGEGPIGPGREGLYRSATVSEASAPPAGKVPMLDVVFRENATAGEISEALRSVGASIVSGPSSLGVYRLRVEGLAAEARPPTAADVAAVAARLKAREPAVVIFAEAVP